MKKIMLGTIILAAPLATISCNSVFNIKVNQDSLVWFTTEKKVVNGIPKEIKVPVPLTIDQYKVLSKNVDLFEGQTKLEFLDNDIKIFKGSDSILASKNSKSFKIIKPLNLKREYDEEENYESIYVGEDQQQNFDYNLLYKKIDFYFKDETDFGYKNWPTLESIVSKIVSVQLGESWTLAIPNFIPTKWIRAKSWIKNQEQISYWEDIILFTLKRYNLPKINRVKITPLGYAEYEATTLLSTPIFKIDLLDKNNKSIVSKENRDKTFIIINNQLVDATGKSPINDFLKKKDIETNFKDYNSKIDFNNNLNINDDEILFNEMVNVYKPTDGTMLKMKKNEFFLDLDYYEKYLHENFYKKATAKGFLWFVKRHFDKYYLSVPKHMQKVDKSYTIKNIEDIKLDDKYLNNSKSIFKITFEREKWNGSKSICHIYSIDLNQHYHTFDGYKVTNDLKFTGVEKYIWNESLGKTDKLEITKYIDPNEFFEKTLLKLLSLQVYEFDENLSLFDGSTMSQYEVHNLENNNKPITVLESYLGLRIFKYLISKSTNPEDWIENIKVEFKGISNTNPGTALIKVDFLDKNGNSMLNHTNQNKLIEWKGFKGTDMSSIYEQMKKYNIKSTSISEILENKDISNPNKIINYFTWKE
ncbi:MAG3240 family lipoprotein [Mycoplasma sp. Mirounga ES2805-ORL]|uniref:MAG3240 family lipoprotein n=1 Tax=Mycoplasma sp. Mirounga ES2805-ORL TaxID=754514 RepID=UPI00197BAD40|nr:hypothetical protein [Mycoplasma sp. Mirounga ES2805-ORL]QSF13765.1 hypothetical protein JXZ90_00480 [Mycoplasma sp. Mirounga ES2805-ORL]